VQGTGVSGSTFAGTTTQIASNQLPTMPTWATAFDYYKTNGTQLTYTSMAGSLPELARNKSVDSSPNPAGSDWIGWPAGVVSPTQIITAAARSPAACLSVPARADGTSGAAQRIDAYVKP